ncbi:hypothetical protein RCL1_003930 [Eukaryota sp. TZLM3-RCL]
MSALGSTVFALLLASLCFANDVHFLPSSGNLKWSRSELWSPTSPTETSNVYIDGTQLDQAVVIDVNVLVNELRLSNVILSIDCFSITVTGFTSFFDSSIESTCNVLSDFNSFNCEFIGVSTLFGINLVILDSGKLIDLNLLLDNSRVYVKENATLFIEHGDSSPLLAWGNGEHGKTGTGVTSNHDIRPVQTDQKFVQVSAGQSHSLGVTRDGFLYSWGSNSGGFLGLGDTSNRLIPTKVALENVIQASVGRLHSLVLLENGDVYSFGGGYRCSQLGHGQSWNCNEFLPRKISTLSNVIDISAGMYHSLAVLSNGEAMAWGDDTFGQLGLSAGDEGVFNSPVRVFLDQTTVKVEAACLSSFFITESGELFSTGYNYDGSLCVGDFSSSTLVLTPIVNSKNFRVVKVSASYFHNDGDHYTTFFLTSDGDVFSCGYYPARDTSIIPAHSPGQVLGLKDIWTLSSSSMRFFAVSLSGTLFSWTSSTSPAPAPETIGMSVGLFAAGSDYYFVQERTPTNIIGNDNSLIEIEGKMENNLEIPLVLNSKVKVHSTGSFLSSFESVKFLQTIENYGSIKCTKSLLFELSSVLVLNGGVIEAKDLSIGESASLFGSGFIDSNVYNYGTIQPTGLLEIEGSLLVSENSQALLEHNSQDVELVVNGKLSIEGTFLIMFPSLLPTNYTVDLVSFYVLVAHTNAFVIQCSEFFDMTVANFSLTVESAADYPGLVSSLGQCPLPLSNAVYLVVPDNNSDSLFWSRTDIWVPYPPDEKSTVVFDGNYINEKIFIDQDVIISSLHLSNVILSIDCFSITVTGFTSFSDSSIESTCNVLSDFNSFNCEFIGVSTLFGINLVILDSGKLIDLNLLLDNSRVFVTENATLFIEHGDSSPLLAWGNGQDGRTGTGVTSNHGIRPVQTDQKFGQVSAGQSHSLGVTRDGFLYSWGSNHVPDFGTTGHLGVGDYSNRLVPTKVDLENVIQAATGDRHSLVLLENGDVYSFGAALYGQLGHGSTSPNLNIPTKVTSISNVVSVSAGHGHSLALLSNGKVMVWGYNHVGQLGIGTAGFSAGKTSPFELSFTHPVKKIVACSDHSFFITESGELFATGSNSNGQLCIGHTSYRNIPTPILNSKSFDVTEVKCSATSSMFLTSEGKVFTCGAVLGRSSSSIPHHSPGEVLGLYSIESIDCSADQMFALSRTGTLFSWSSGSLAAPTVQTSGLYVSQIFMGFDHFFIHEMVRSNIGGEDSLIEIEGKFVSNATSFLTIFPSFTVLSYGSLTSSFAIIRFENSFANHGLVTVKGLLELNRLLTLDGGVIEATEVFIHESASLIGSGFIDSNVYNYGTIQPTGLLEIQKNLLLFPSSVLLFSSIEFNITTILVNEAIYFGGRLFIDYFYHRILTGSSFDLILFTTSFGEFTEVSVTCETLFEVNYIDNSIDLQVVSDFPDLFNGQLVCPTTPISLAVPHNNSDSLFWSRTDIWVPYPPDEKSTVVFDGNYIKEKIFIDQDVIISSLHLSNVILSIDCFSITVTGFTSFSDSSIESTCNVLADFKSFNCEFIGVSTLFGINLVIFDSGKLIDLNLILDNSRVFVKENATLFVEHGDTSPLLAWGNGEHGRTDHNSLIEIEGKMENNLQVPLVIDSKVKVHSTGKFLSTFESVKFLQTIENYGSIKCTKSLLFDLSSVLVLNGGVIEATEVFIHESASLIGSGFIDSNVYNYGKIQPTGLLDIQKNLHLFPSSVLLFSSIEFNITTILVNEAIYVGGSLVIDYFYHRLLAGSSFDLILFTTSFGEFTEVSVTCETLFEVIYNDNSIDLQVVSDFPDLFNGQLVCPTTPISLVVPLNNSDSLFWSRTDIWVPYPPDEKSTVVFDGNYINEKIFIDQDVIISSLHLSNVILSIDCVSITVTGFTSIFDSSIESTCNVLSDFNSFNCEFIGVSTLFGINLIILDSGKLIDLNLLLDSSRVYVKENATLFIEHGDSSPLLAWGNGQNGRTGTGVTSNHDIRPVQTDQSFVQVSAGRFHSLGVTRDGFLFGWGLNTGYLGLSGSSNCLIPTRAVLENVIQVSVKFYHSLVLIKNGDVYSFGGYEYCWCPELGHGRGYECDLYCMERSPRKISTLSNVVDISAGMYHSLAVLSNGEAMAWGEGYYGQLGVPFKDRENSAQHFPFRVHLNETIVKATAGDTSSFFITESRELFTTGYNEDGNLCVGYSSLDIGEDLPTPIVNSKNFRVVQVSTRFVYNTHGGYSSTTFFLTSDGDVFSCGSSPARNTSIIPAHSPGQVLGLKDIWSISSSSSHFFAVSLGGTLFSWTSSTSPAPAPETIGMTVGLFAAGSDHYFVQERTPTNIIGSHKSLIEIEGKMENNLEVPLVINSKVKVHSTGKFLSSFESVKFLQTIENYGSIKCTKSLLFELSSVLVLNGGVIEAKDLSIGESASLIGSGFIDSNVYNYGTIQPTGLLEIQKNLHLFPSSVLLFSRIEFNITTVLVNEAIYFGGRLVIDYFYHRILSGTSFDLILFMTSFGEFTEVSVTCEILFEVIYNDNSIDLQVVSDFPDLFNGQLVCPTDLFSPLVPLNNSDSLFWSRTDIWVPYPPDEKSTVVFDGNYINEKIFIDQDVIISSLHLSNVILSIDCFSITVTGFTSFSDSSIESTCNVLSDFKSFNCEFIGVSTLFGINLVILDSGKLIGFNLLLDNSGVFVKENATLFIEHGDSSPLLAWDNGQDGRTDRNSLIEIEGKMENNLKVPLVLNSKVKVHSTGKILSSFESVKFLQTIENYGSIKCTKSLLFELSSVLVLDGGVIEATEVFIHESASLIGSGFIDSNVYNYGKIQPTGLLEIQKNLHFFPSSVLLFSSIEFNITTILVNEAIYFGGRLFIDYFYHRILTGSSFDLILFTTSFGEFTEVSVTCETLFEVIYNDNSINLQVVSDFPDLFNGQLVCPTPLVSTDPFSLTLTQIILIIVSIPVVCFILWCCFSSKKAPTLEASFDLEPLKINPVISDTITVVQEQLPEVIINPITIKLPQVVEHQSIISSVCSTISNMKDHLAEWEPQQYIDSIASPVLDTVSLLTSYTTFLPIGTALGTLFKSIKNVKINKTQAAVLGARVLRLTKLTLSQLETNIELSKTPMFTEILKNFTNICNRVNTVVVQHDDAQWYKRTFTHEKFKREFELCNKLLDDFSSELLIAFAGKTFEKLPPLSQQKVDAIIEFDQDTFNSSLADYNQMLLKEMRQQFQELQRELASATEKSVKAALEEKQNQHTEQRKAIQNNISKIQTAKEVKPNILAVELEIDWETSIFSGQSEVVHAEYALSEVVLKLYYGTGTMSPELVREFSILNSLPNVPSLPRIFGLTLVPKNGKERYGVVMERLSGTSLKEKVAMFKTQSKKLDVLISIGNALVACHESKFLHRDLKPDNILFRGGCPVIIDWGSGKHIGNSNMSLSLNANRILTPTWASPELVSDQTVYADSIDVFSFALISVFVFSQESIWQDFEGFPNRDQLIIDSLRSGDIPDIPHHSSLPSSILPLLRQCLMFNYLERPSMSQVVSVLSALRHGTPPVDCLGIENVYLCEFGLACINEDFVLNNSMEVVLEIYSKISQLMEYCYSQELCVKFRRVLSLIERIHRLPQAVIDRKQRVDRLLDQRFTRHADVPVFDVNNLPQSDYIDVIVE